MKLQVTKAGAAGRKIVRGKGFSIEVTSKSADIEIPARGFIECKDIKLRIFTNTAKQIVKFELTLAKEVHVYKDDHPFILWAQLEKEIEYFLEAQNPKKAEDTLVGVGKKRIAKRK